MTMAAAAPAAVPMSAGEAAARTTDLIDLAMRLSRLLAQETGLVRAMRIQEIAPLQAEKLRLTRRYQAALKALGEAGMQQQDVPLPLRGQLVATGQRLAEAAAENELALRVGRTATGRLIAAIASAVNDLRPSTSGYTARRAPPRAARVAGMAVDRRL